MSHDYDTLWKDQLKNLETSFRRRRLKHYSPQNQFIDFASNDSLDLRQDQRLIERTIDYAKKWGVGAGASRLVTGTMPCHSDLESKIASLKKAESALLFASGFQANCSLIPALLDYHKSKGKALLFVDKFIHSSLIQGCLASQGQIIRFRHNDLTHLKELLERYKDSSVPKMIVSETVFSMDGDCADIEKLQEIAHNYRTFLYLDEAHATGLYGENAMGLASAYANSDCLVMGTFSKALGSFGAYAVCSQVLKDYLLNRCGGFIYSTALPPPLLGSIEAALDLLPLFEKERQTLFKRANDFRQSLKKLGLNFAKSSSHIVPIIIGDEQKTMALSQMLFEANILVIAIRPPTVPPMTSRLRFSFARRHSQEDLDYLIDCLAQSIKQL